MDMPEENTIYNGHFVEADTFRMTFPTTFSVAAGAVHDRLLLHHLGYPIFPKEESSGLYVATLFDTRIALPNIGARIVVLERAPELVTLRLDRIVPLDPIERDMRAQDLTDYLYRDVIPIYKKCGEAIVESIRHTFPVYGIDYVETFVPPPPIPTDDHGWVALVLWKDLHAPRMSHEELRGLIANKREMPIRTLYNRYSDALGILEGTKKAKPLDTLSQGKIGRGKSRNSKS